MTTVTQVDRELFVPDVIWVPTGDGYQSVSRVDDPAKWAAAVDADEPVVTQVDDGATPPGQIGRSATSSSSQPSLVASMLDALDATRGMRVLEIGTGTGQTAKLLCDRLGDEAVTTIELDTAVSEQARVALERVGCQPAVIVGDGAAGYVAGAPYDRISVTCAVSRVPYAWVEQTKPNGLVLTPWGTEYHNGALARLVVHGDGSASGHFTPLSVAFMRLRDQRTDVCPWDEDGPGEPDVGVTELSSGEVYELIGPGALAIGLRMPNCHKVVDNLRLHVSIHDPGSGSWTRCQVTPGPGPHPVAQHGPRRLWDEVEQAHAWWVEQGRPSITRFGLIVTASSQNVWLDHPGNTVISLS